MPACARQRLQSSRKKLRCQSIRKLSVCVMFLTILPRLALASDVCGLLDHVVAASEENPPFGSVVHLLLPGSECRVKGKWDLADGEARRSYVCTWSFSNRHKAHVDFLDRVDQGIDTAVDAEERADFAKEDLDWRRTEVEGEKEDYRSSEKLFNRICRNPSLQHLFTEECLGDKQELDRLAANIKRMQLALDEEDKRVEALEEEAERLKREAERLESEASRLEKDIEKQVNFEARKLMHAIKDCLYKKEIRGSWTSFETVEAGKWRTIRSAGDCPYSQCEMKIHSERDVVFESVVSN